MAYRVSCTLCGMKLSIDEIIFFYLMNLPSQNFGTFRKFWCPDLKVLISDNGRRQSFARTTIKTATSRSWDSSYGPKDDSFLLRPDRVGKTEEKVNYEVKETLWFSTFYVDLCLRHSTRWVSDIQHTIAQANTKTPQQGSKQHSTKTQVPP